MIGKENLIRKAKKQDKDAFCELIQEHKLSMYKVAKAILRNDDDVADAMQETILDCWEKLSTLRENRYFKTWMTRILINNCNSIYQKNKKVQYYDTVPEQKVKEAGYERLEWLEILDELEENQRIVVDLYYREQFKVREIANVLQIGQSAVKGRLQAARKKLSAYYQMENQEDKKGRDDYEKIREYNERV